MERIELAGGCRAIELGPEALIHPRSTAFAAAFAGRRRTPWSDVTDLAVGRAGLRLASLGSVFFLRRKAFLHASGPEALARAVVSAIAARPGGAEQLGRIQALGERAVRAPHARYQS